MHIAVVEHSRAETAPPLSHLSAVIATPLADPHHTGGRARVAHDTRATRARWHERTFSPTFRTLGEIHRLRSPRWRLPRRPAQPPWPYSTLMAPSRRRDASRRRVCVPTGGRCGIVFPPSRVSTPLCNAPAHRRRVLPRGADICPLSPCRNPATPMRHALCRRRGFARGNTTTSQPYGSRQSASQTYEHLSKTTRTCAGAAL